MQRALIDHDIVGCGRQCCAVQYALVLLKCTYVYVRICMYVHMYIRMLARNGTYVHLIVDKALLHGTTTASGEKTCTTSQ